MTTKNIFMPADHTDSFMPPSLAGEPFQPKETAQPAQATQAAQTDKTDKTDQTAQTAQSVKTSKEQIYDEQISPLMAQILEIAEKHGIALIANFYIPTENAPDLQAMSQLPDQQGVTPTTLLAAARALRPAPKSVPLMVRTEHGNGEMTLTAFE